MVHIAIGVLRTDIDPLEPKITVVGNVNPHILIRKLLKVGKHAELCSYVEVVKDEKKEEKTTISKDKDKKQDSGCKQDQKQIEKIKDVPEGGVANAYDFGPQEILKKEDNYAFLHHPQVNFMVHHGMPLYDNNMKNHPQYCYISQPCSVAVPYYAMPYSYPAAPSACSVEECSYHFERSKYQSPYLRPTVRVGDYFSDENTLGCNVM